MRQDLGAARRSPFHTTLHRLQTACQTSCVDFLNYQWVRFSVFRKKADYLLFRLVAKTICGIKKGYSYR